MSEEPEEIPIDVTCPWCKGVTDTPGDGAFDGTRWVSTCCGREVVAAETSLTMVLLKGDKTRRVRRKP